MKGLHLRALGARIVMVVLLCLGAPAAAWATTFTDTITASQTFNVASSPLGGIAGCNLIVGTHVYGSRVITVSTSRTYTMRVTASTGLGNDPFLAVYEGSFNPASPTTNLRACNDDANGTLLPELQVNLVAGRTYVIMTTTYGAGSLPGTATYQITPDIDIVPPAVLSGVGISGVDATNAILAGTSNVAATGYWVVQPQGQAAPDAGRVRAGQNSSGAAALRSGNGPMTAGNAASFPIAGLVANTGYTAYLIAERAPTLWSTVAAVNFTTASTVPAAPVISSVTAGNGEATIHFTPPANGGSAITGYTVTASPGGAILTGTGSPIVMTGLSNGVAYTFTVYATNANGNGAVSAPSAPVTPLGPPTLSAFGDLTRTYGDAAFALTPPTSDSAGAFTYTSSDPAVATISGDVVTLVGVGTSVITANQAADGGFTAGSITASLTVSTATPVLSGFPDLSRTFGDAAFTLVQPTSNSAGAFAYSSSDPSVATVSGDSVTIVGAGNATITATQAADGNYSSAQIVANLSVAAAAPTLSAFPDLSRTFGDAAFTLSTPTSNSAGTFTYTSSNAAVATISGDVVTITGAGIAIITATQAAHGNYAAAQISAQLTVDVATPVLSGFADLSRTFGDADFALTPPTSDSTGAFTYISSNPSVATVSGDVVTIVGAGTATITATQAADGNYASAQTTAQLVVDTAVPTISGFPNLSRTYGDAAFTLTAPTSDSTGAFTYASSNPAVATIAGDVVTITGAGTATITATQAASGNYATAQVTAQLAVDTAVPTLSGFPNLTRTFGDADFILVAPTSDSAGAFTYTSSDPSVATVSGNVVTITGAGNATITATQAADGSYASTQITAILSVETAVPALSGFANLTRTYGDVAFALTAPTSNSAGAFTYTSSDPSVATISGDVVTITGAGTTTITAIQAADGNYASAQTTAQLAVGVATPTLSGFANLTRTYGDAAFALTPPMSESAGAFTYTSSDPAVATISGDVVTITGAGTTTITATQAADGNYASAQATAQLAVGVAAPTLSGFANLTRTYGDAAFALTPPTSDSAGAFTYSSSDPSVATIIGDVVTIVGAGTTTITATQAADGNYASAQATAQLAVDTAVPTLSGFADLTRTYGDAAFALTPPTSNSAGAFTYTSSDPSVATISGDVVTIVGAGTTTITATQAADGSFATAQIAAQLTVDVAVPLLSGFEDIVKTMGEPAFELPLPASASNGAFSFTIDEASVATVDGRIVTLVGAGVATITVTQAASGNYAEASATATLTVSDRPDPTKDASVVAGLQAQVDATVRFALAQQANIHNRLRQRRSGGDSANGLSVSMANSGGGLSWSPTLVGESQVARRQSPWSLWTGGTISSGSRDPRNGGEGFDFQSDGLSFGVDRWLGERSLLGVATGFGWSDLDLDSSGSRVKGNYQSIALYGLWKAGEHLFVDGQLGYGDIGFRVDRWSDVAGGIAHGRRDGTQVSGAVTFGYEQAMEQMRLATYGRLSAGRATLDEYREHGIGIYDLRYAEQDVEHSMAALGVEGSHDLAVGSASLRPYWTLEYWNNIGRNSDALINYVNAPVANDYRLGLTTFSTANWHVGLGADLRLRNGVTVSGLVRHEAGGSIGGVTTFGLQFSLNWDASPRMAMPLSLDAGDLPPQGQSRHSAKAGQE
ncbi:autotransporter domain-containing protein [Luteimonas aestuarii]|uniref:Autotransporter domain-containing protein n=1 Tax=Luteimonas aestuarii TaxID=453837 RepID=A0A4R5U0X6_9GAMM|nr:Ig-like domain-containing protein [Luteimonas aestuarii]TDK27162.1 autotransporter domain-containing protein [Luteimonas aestuarii]